MITVGATLPSSLQNEKSRTRGAVFVRTLKKTESAPTTASFREKDGTWKGRSYNRSLGH